jgi:hypothetical protein
MNLATHLHPLPRLGMRGAVHSLHPYAFMAYAELMLSEYHILQEHAVPHFTSCRRQFLTFLLCISYWPLQYSSSPSCSVLSNRIAGHLLV